MAVPGDPQLQADLQGLSEQEAQARLTSEGFNELPRHDHRTPLRIALEVLREPMLALLLGAGVVYLLLGDIVDAIVLMMFATFSVLITVVQEARTEKVLEALRDLTSPRALVIRGGERKRIAGREVVRGDVIVLAEGDRVPADAMLVDCHDLTTDESLLTGESVPVRKAIHDGAERRVNRPGGDDLPFVFSGSLVVRGTGIAQVSATGLRSEIGKIGQSLGELSFEPPRLQRQTRRFVRIFAVIGGSVSLLAVLLFGLMRGGWLDALLAGIALGMSMLPEEFPVVLTIFMAMGAWRISRARVLTRRAAAIETLGSATVLCTDKTGTLTENRMTIAELRLADGSVLSLSPEAKLPDGFRDLVRCGVLASAPHPFDPMEKAFHALGHLQADGAAAEDLASWKLVRAYGLRPELLAMTHVWRMPEGGDRLVAAAKGAPEAVAKLCGMDRSARTMLAEQIDAMADEGLRVLGVARATVPDGDLPASQLDFGFEFMGLVGLADPLRPGVPAAIGECKSAGIRVTMITGDYPATARSIARQAGLEHAEVITGDMLEALDDATLAERLRTATVFARIMPEQKLRIVSALKMDGEVVAMTGDGVNDSPSLKAAHIGIAMGGRGTDVAREASSIVLLDDDFGSIVKAIRLGRRIYDNLRKAIGFIFAIHIPIAGLALLPLVTGMPIVLGPLHIAFLEMIIDPVCTLVFEAEREEDDVMRRPPRPPAEPLFSRSLVAWSILQGVVGLAAVVMIYVASQHLGLPEGEVRALSFVSLVTVIVSFIFVNRSFSASLIAALTRPNPALAIVLAIVASMLVLVLFLPFAGSLLRFTPFPAAHLVWPAGAAFAALVLLEALKPLLRERRSG